MCELVKLLFIISVVCSKFYAANRNFTRPPVPPVPTNMMSGIQLIKFWFSQVRPNPQADSRLSLAPQNGPPYKKKGEQYTYITTRHIGIIKTSQLNHFKNSLISMGQGLQHITTLRSELLAKLKKSMLLLRQSVHQKVKANCKIRKLHF